MNSLAPARRGIPLEPIMLYTIIEAFRAAADALGDAVEALLEALFT